MNLAAEPTTTLALVNWGAVTGEIKGAIGVGVAVATLWVIVKVAKGDVPGFAKIAMSAVIGLIAVGLFFVMSDPAKVQSVVGTLFNLGN